jgi:hypothetical protein
LALAAILVLLIGNTRADKQCYGWVPPAKGADTG